MQINDNKAFLFVYGSMKKNFFNSYLLKEQEFFGVATTRNKYKMYPSDDYLYPYLFTSDIENGNEIHGELYLVDMEYLKSVIDKVEGVDIGHYKRETLTVVTEEQEEVMAFVYIASSLVDSILFDEDASLSEWTKHQEQKGLRANSYLNSLSKVN